MYSYHEVEAIKTNLEWIVNQLTFKQSSPSGTDLKALFDLLELIQSYEMLLDLIRDFGTDVIDAHIAEGLAVTLHLYGNDNIEVLCLGCGSCIIDTVFVETGVKGVLHIVTRMMAICGNVHTFFDKRLIKFIKCVILACQVDHGTRLAFMVDHK